MSFIVVIADCGCFDGRLFFFCFELEIADTERYDTRLRCCLSNIEHVVSQTLKVSKHLRIDNASVAGAYARLEPLKLVLAVNIGKVVDLLLDLGHLDVYGRSLGLC